MPDEADGVTLSIPAYNWSITCSPYNGGAWESMSSVWIWSGVWSRRLPASSKGTLGEIKMVTGSEARN